jgi:hypothetical protein
MIHQRSPRLFRADTGARFVLLLAVGAAALFGPWSGNAQTAASGGNAMARRRTSSSRNWRIRVGPVYRMDARVEVSWDADSILREVDPWNGSGSVGSSSIGPESAYANRDYVDGFVYIDPGTADPDTDRSGLTWYWGYENARQYSGDSVTFRGESFSRWNEGGTAGGALTGEEKQNAAGLRIDLDRWIWNSRSFAAGITAGFGGYQPLKGSWEIDSSQTEGAIESYHYEDTYSAPYSPFPAAPYRGTYDGPGYLLNNQPDSRRRVLEDRTDREIQIHSSFEYDFFFVDFRLGPSFAWRPAENCAVFLFPYFSAEYLDGNAVSTTEWVTSTGERGRLSNRAEFREWLFAGAVEIGVEYRFSERWTIGLASSAQCWGKELDVSVPPFEAALDSGKWSGSAYVGCEF